MLVRGRKIYLYIVRIGMTTPYRAFVDTNVLIRATVATAPLHQEALTILNRLYEDSVELWISRQVLREYLVSITRQQTYAQPVQPEIAVAQIKAFEERFQVADETVAVSHQLLEIIQRFPVGGKQIHDANIVATMLVYGVDSLVTHNISDFKRFSDLINLMSIEP